MTAFLASVMSAAEADIVCAAGAAGADIVDLKDPRHGALGALPATTISTIVRHVAGRHPVSATIGDLPMVPDVVVDAVRRTATLGVDIVKIGIFPGPPPTPCIDALAPLAGQGVRLVAVLFADAGPDMSLLDKLADNGFTGVMLDTVGKRSGGLRSCLDDERLGKFVERSRHRGLLTGLAGSLTIDDIAPLLALQPDYLGFRGALTSGGRDGAVDPHRVARIRAAIPADAQGPTAISATATAGAQRAAAALVSSAPSTSVAKST